MPVPVPFYASCSVCVLQQLLAASIATTMDQRMLVSGPGNHSKIIKRDALLAPHYNRVNSMYHRVGFVRDLTLRNVRYPPLSSPLLSPLLPSSRTHQCSRLPLHP